MRLIQVAAAVVLPLAFAQKLLTDTGKSGPALEIIHLYDGQWPDRYCCFSQRPQISCFPAGLDPANTNNGLNGKFQVAELKGKSTEVEYPSKEINNPPGGAVNRLSVPPVTRGLSKYLLGVQSVVVDSEDTLWLLDTGRVTDLTNPASPLLNATHGGPKLISVDLKTNKVTRTIVFASDVALPQSYFNDVRFDHSRGFAYITDSSPEGFNAIVTLNLKTEKAWRSLAGKNSPTHAIKGTVPWVSGDPMYQILMPLSDVIDPTSITFGSDGIGLDPTGDNLYFSSIGGRFLYSVPTQALRERHSNIASVVTNHGEKGISDGLEVDSNGVIYGGNAEQNAISMFNTKRNLATTFVRDPRINWVDTMSIATDGYLYFTVNQVNRLLAIYPGKGLPLVDRRVPPYALFRVKLPHGGPRLYKVLISSFRLLLKPYFVNRYQK